MLSDLQYLKINARLVEFADDVIVIWCNDDANELALLVENDLKCIEHYYTSNGLKINSNKSKYIIFGKRKAPIIDSKLNLFDYERIDEIRYLGICIDSGLKLRNHYELVARKLKLSIGALKSIK
ncbi:hypothetical protein PVAND_017681, partial [Polypedilum vanderplanki]